MPSADIAILDQDIDGIYRDHHGWLRGWLRRRLGCSEAAADLAHDTYLRVLTTGKVPPVGESRRYLTRIAKGLVIDRYRRQQIEAAYIESLRHLPEPQVPGAETQQMIIESLIEIDIMLHSLPTKVRKALLLRQLDGLSYKSIAAELAVSVSSVEKYVARGLAACYLALENGR